MIYLVISDIHLGSPLFKSEDTIMKLLSDSKYSKIFILGDIIDIKEKKKEKILFKYLQLIKLINEISNVKEVIILKGNHDPSINELDEIFPLCKISELYISTTMESIFIHGDQYDKFEQESKILKSLLFNTQWFLERIFKYNVRDNVIKLFYKISSFFTGNNISTCIVTEAEKNACSEYKNSSKIRTIFMGHTHMPKIILNDNLNYVNCGDWIINKSYIEFDTITKNIDLIKL